MSFISLQPIDPNQRYAPHEAAVYLRIGRSKLFDKIRAGELRSIKDGKHRLVPGSEIVRLSTLPQPERT